MRKAVATCPGVGFIPDRECPTKTYVGTKLTQIEENTPPPRVHDGGHHSR